jgi:hypothetical protein
MIVHINGFVGICADMTTPSWLRGSAKVEVNNVYEENLTEPR